MSKKVSSNGIGIGTLIFIVFLTLKLGEIGQVANWSWWWVTSPLWIPLVIVLGILTVVGLFALIVAIFPINSNKTPTKARKSKFESKIEELREKNNYNNN
jgi:small Trp-rich protein